MGPHEIAALLAASFVAGVMNALAGGGSLVTYPTLVFLGQPAILANATSAVALLPGAGASLLGYRAEVWEHRAWLRSLFLPSLVGGAAGSVLLLGTPEHIFADLAPFLVLAATVLFMLRGTLARSLARSARSRHPTETGGGPALGAVPDPAQLGRGRILVATLLQLGVAVYGGYFGAGIGILMLGVLGLLGLADIHAMNGLKSFFGVSINAVAAAYFIARGAVAWPLAPVMMVGAVAGGYGGARFARRIGQRRARGAVVVIGLSMAVLLFWQRARG